MDSLITAAARALAAGDPLGALNRIALRDDPPALALRGIAMAQLGDLSRARALVRAAARAFGLREAVARARCLVAEAEIALAARDLAWPAGNLEGAAAVLEAHGDHLNAAHARYLCLRRLLLLGRVEEAEAGLARLDPAPLPPALKTGHALVGAGIALRRLDTGTARTALAQAREAARRAGIPALAAEVEHAARVLEQPAARLIEGKSQRLLRLDEVAALLAGDALVVDACRHAVQGAGRLVPLARRPVLFALARALADGWPGDVSRAVLVTRAFRARQADESHRARLRVEIGRLRSLLKGLATISATADGFAISPCDGRRLALLTRPAEEAHAGILALLADGEAWASSALALALDTSQRSVQRALDQLQAAGKVQAVGRARARRWMTPPVPGFTTVLLLPGVITRS